MSGQTMNKVAQWVLAIAVFSAAVAAGQPATSGPAPAGPAAGMTQPLSPSVAAPSSATAPAPPSVAASVLYVGRITGNGVYIRSGPAEVYYEVAQANKGQTVIVREERRGVNNWARIDPTPECFSWIAKEYVRLETAGAGRPAAGGAEAGRTEPNAARPAAAGELSGTWKKPVPGVVIGNNVRVRAGSRRVPPVNASQVQVRLQEGESVQVLGEQDNFYKIACPAGASFWVSLDYVARQGALTPEIEAQVRAQASTAVGETAVVRSEGAAPGGTTTGPTTTPSASADRVEYERIVQLLAAERDKPMAQQDFAPIRARYEALRQKAQSPSVVKAVDSLEKHLARCETAQDIWKTSQRQDEQLQQTLARIDQQLQLLAAPQPVETRKPLDVTVQGRIAESAVFTNPGPDRRYLVIGDDEKIACYAVATGPGIDLSRWVGQRVSLTGPLDYDGFSRAKVLRVLSLAEMATGR